MKEREDRRGFPPGYRTRVARVWEVTTPKGTRIMSRDIVETRRRAWRAHDAQKRAQKTR